MQPLLEQVLKQYPNKVKLVFKNFPLPSIHKFGQKAAVAAHAAGEQGKFWEYHDSLFKDLKNINDDKLAEIATNLGLDMNKFYQDMNNQKIVDLVNADYQEGLNVGVRGTPAIFVNGRLLKQRNFKGFVAIIEDELRKMGVKQ